MSTSSLPSSSIRPRVARDKDPLRHRRVRDADGREGRIEGSHVSSHVSTPPAIGGRVHWDDLEKPWDSEWVRDFSDLTMLDAPQITLPVFVRKVLFRGRKEQVAEFVMALAPLDAAAVEQGARRYVEFDPQPAAYRRWRVVYQGPPMTPEQVAETPDQAPGAEQLRKVYRDISHDYDEPGSYA